MIKLTRTRLSCMSVGAILGILAITACGQTTAQSFQVSTNIDLELARSAETACLRHRSRAEVDDDEFVGFLSQSCTNVLADISQPGEMEDQRAELASRYLEALVALERETSDLMRQRRETRTYPLRPNRVGEFLMAHHLGLMDSYGFWRHAYLRDNPA